MIEPLIKSTDVPCGREQAFDIFVSEMDSWWPLSRFTVSAFTGGVARSLRVEAELGGTIVETTHDGKEYLWGTIKSFDPHDSMSMDFHIPHPTEVVKDRSLVELQFTALEPDRTRVTLTQSNWEALGEHGAALRGGYGGGWDIIFVEAYAKACSG